MMAPPKKNAPAAQKSGPTPAAAVDQAPKSEAPPNAPPKKQARVTRMVSVMGIQIGGGQKRRTHASFGPPKERLSGERTSSAAGSRGMSRRVMHDALRVAGLLQRLHFSGD